jgi:zinc protease
LSIQVTTSNFQFNTRISQEPPDHQIIGYKLPNGLQVVFLKKKKTPIVAVNLWYKVGSKDEKASKSGFAHLFEHMMFEGSKNVAKAEHMRLINQVGGMVNGSTTQDRTNYWEVVPNNQLELALWLEADRMHSLNLNLENFENQRATVKEERRLRIDNQPYMKVVYELKDDIAYSNFAYKHSVIGSMEDLDNATLKDVREFHNLYYRPNNAVLSLVGDFEILRTVDLIEKNFGHIPRGSEVPIVDLTEPAHLSESRIKYRDQFAPFPAVLISYHIPDRKHHDYYPVNLIEKIMFDGESSRFYRRLVEEKQVALHLVGGEDGKIGSGLFFIFAQLHPQKSLSDLISSIDEEFNRLNNELVDESEIIKAKNKVRADFVAQEESVRTHADLLSYYTTVFNNPAHYLSERTWYESIGREELLKTNQKYFRQENRSVIEIYPQMKNIKSVKNN